MTTTYNKLVRSKILEILDAKGITHKSHIADKAEYGEKLYEKLVEESGELAKDRNKEELADLLEVIEAVKKMNSWDTQEIEEIRLKKRSERGDFESPIILEES
jgi:predicted house-cleaning noncanonical NTP pyrophosphatase (MazG superfamily)